MATLNISLLPKTLNPIPKTLTPLLSNPSTSALSFLPYARPHPIKSRTAALPAIRALNDGEYSATRNSRGEERETILLPGCDYNHWLIVMEFPKDPAPTREQMIDTYLNTLATVLGRSHPVCVCSWVMISAFVLLLAISKLLVSMDVFGGIIA